jgi:hypothetical protein
MDLNNMGAGKKLIEYLIKQGSIRRMGWSRQQQKAQIDTQKNSKPETK